MRDSAQITTPTTPFKRGQFVLYRDPEMFWTGTADHTFVCRIERSWMDGTHDLIVIATGRPVHNANPDYMRLLPAIDAMRDIDTAPLNINGGVGDLTAAAIAWLHQQHATANQRPQLPAQSD
ncbi:hypothetical protein QT196_38875 (plasmid) [Streptomyces sp. P9-2B-2]|uniref:hypothetical protein n=1 Tax=Streptomyces sp. P9-2B-2 TaxID=3057114 RepID=UPI0025B4BEB4|nr:hypothetical protein [Streptomyces sp. P9-2B-2]WJY43228.1 hypothetical protein QT196_38875 [Streptomyces sp. P9-2B-2]